MPRADRYVSSLFPANANKTTVRARALSASESHSLSAALDADSNDLYFSAWVTFLDAIRGTDAGFFSWAAVKCYYTIFYALRSHLAFRKTCTFHVGDGFYSVQAIPGSVPHSNSDRGDHKTVLNTFARQFPAHVLLSQEIDFIPPFEWFTRLRERSNYQREKFTEPGASDEFSGVLKSGLRAAVNEYLQDSKDAFTFDRDHAILAYPLRVLRLVGRDIHAAGLVSVTNDQKVFLRNKSRDGRYVLKALIEEIKSVGLQ